MKQFLVTNKDNQIVDARRIRDIISECFPFGIDIEVSELTPELISQLAQMQPKPQLPVIETGVLMSPAEKCEGATSIDFGWLTITVENQDIGKRVDLKKYGYPKHMYKDIKTEIDYSKIQVGSVVEFTTINKAEKRIGEICDNVNEVVSLKTFDGLTHIGINDFKSLQILQLPEGK